MKTQHATVMAEDMENKMKKAMRDCDGFSN
jgi:hypothetical protein